MIKEILKIKNLFNLNKSDSSIKNNQLKDYESFRKFLNGDLDILVVIKMILVIVKKFAFLKMTLIYLAQILIQTLQMQSLSVWSIFLKKL